MKQPDDPMRAGHILDAGELVLQWTAGKTRAEFDEDLLLQSAVAHQVQIIGEAASRLTDAFRRTHADVPWRSIIGMRNILVHDYMDVERDRMWDVVTNHLPPLLEIVR
ncbi:MAG: DUF86 domain-containing protein, partial [Chloroflexi bacterium]|nr:DUF86 domain-containing protein [Chloroflexota bacterium]